MTVAETQIRRPHLPMPQKLVTLQRHIAQEQIRHEGASGDFSALLHDLILAFKIISREVNKAGLINILGETEDTNVHGEVQKKLDQYAQDTIFRSMDHGGHLCVMASEEEEDPIQIPSKYEKGDYVLLYDPLDGSSNIDVNVSIGTIWSVHRRISDGEDGYMKDILQPGYKQVAAGYAIYGSSTVLVYTTGAGVHGFTLDPSVGEFLLSHENIKTPKRGKIYSINEGNVATWDDGTRRFVEYLKSNDNPNEKPYRSRYIGSLVADFHRNLLMGGIFLYPADMRDPQNPKAKLRLLYEGAPLAMIAHAAGGLATTGHERILDIQPTDIHQKIPIIIGSEQEVLEFEQFFRGER